MRNVEENLQKIPKEDIIVITTARLSCHKKHTVKALEHLGVRYDHILFDVTSGPRILVNDIKPPGVVGNKEPITTAYAVNLNRDEGITPYTQLIGSEHKKITD